MTTLLITFKWEETEEMSYDKLIDHLSFLGAYDIEEEEAPPEPERPRTERKKK